MKVTMYVRDIGRIRGSLKVQKDSSLCSRFNVNKQVFIALTDVYIADAEPSLSKIPEVVVNVKDIILMY